MSTRIKICGITRVADAVHAAQQGADAIGLVFFAGSARNVAAEQACAIAFALPPFVTKVGLFVNASAAQVRAVLDVVPIDLLQFHGDETADFCAQFRRPYMKAVRVGPQIDLLQCARTYEGACALLLDAQVAGSFGGTGQRFDWRLIPRELPLPVVLSGGLNPDNVTEAVRQVRPWAVDVSSGVEVNEASEASEASESSKGRKDPAKVTRFIQGVRHADV
jgi:phosphoribosylanthranilate isomerase